jgi:hypothetical protein
MLSVVAARRVSRRAVLLVCFLLSLVASRASAQTDPEQLKKARAQFQQATEMEQAGNYSAALQAFREVGQFRMTPQVRFHIALCEEKLGKLVAALGGYELALAGADALGPDFRDEVEGMVKSLKERLPKLVIERGSGADAATIGLDGVTLGASSIGVELPVDPGPHTVTATAQGFQDFSETVTLGEKETKPIKVELEAAAAEQPTLPDEPSEAPPPPPPQKHTWVPWALGGVGVAALGTALVFDRLRQSNLDDGLAHCVLVGDQYQCDFGNHPEDEKKVSSARNYNTAALVFVGVGAAAIGAGVVVYLLQNRKSEPAKKAEEGARLELRPSAPRSDLGLSLVGRF